MDDKLVTIALVAIGTAITVGTVVYQAGKMTGTMNQRMDDFDRRLCAIEEWLMKLGVTMLRRSDIKSQKH